MRDTIKKHTDFIMSDTDPMARSAYFVVRAKNARFANNPRIGFTATKHTFKLAVDRNRAKRLMRDWVAFHQGLLADEFDYVFIARTPILNADRESGRMAMDKALKHIIHKYVSKEKRKFFKDF